MTIDVKQARDVSSVVQAAIDRHGDKEDALIPVLNEVNEKLGYLPVDAMSKISQLLRMPDSQLLSTASFYKMLSTKPRGQYVVQFCESAPCHVMGGRKVWQVLQEEMGLNPGETSDDGKWTLLATSCPGLCGVGPVMMVNDDLYGNVTPERISEILANYE